jgi:signal transduction histidine kinase
MRRSGVAVVVVAGALYGLAAEHAAYDWDDVRRWLPDLVVGWVLLGCGAVGWLRRPDSRVGPLLTATGFAWFAGNFAGDDVGILAWLGANLVFLHRALLVHCVLSFPSGRLTGRVDRAFVVTAYVVCLTPLARDAAVVTLLGVVLVAVALRPGAPGAERRARGARVRAACAVGGALAASALLHTVTVADAHPIVLLAYQAVLCGTAVGLVVALLRSPWEGAALTDLVVQLAGSPAGSLRDALADALGDPTLQVGYWVAGADVYVDAGGRPLELHGQGGRMVTRIAQDGRPLAVLVHDDALVEDPRLVEAIAAATRLGAVNARLRADVQAQSDEVTASRRRLLHAADEERKRLQHRLEAGAGRTLEILRDELHESQARTAHSDTPSPLHSRLSAAAAQLEDASSSLRDLSRGLHPPLLASAGLGGALDELARHTSAEVTVEVTPDRLPTDIEVTAYYVCAEALSNVAKHANATEVVVTAGVRAGHLVLSVVDDGVGGASNRSGTGLRGVADRVEALGGRLTLASEPGQGTRLVAELPLGDGTS